MNPFTHLHVHSEYSLLDGSAKITELVSRAKEMGMDSLALTDHGVMFGVIDFYKEAKKQGIKPILGCEVYVARGSRFDREKNANGAYFHLVLLAENETGYRNLIKLVSLGFTEGFYYKPRVDIEAIRKYHEGLIALSACMSGVVSKTLLTVSYQHALEQALLYDEIFGRGNYFLELQDHGLADQQTVNPQLIRIHQETGIPMVCTNDSHYISRADAKPHEILLCIQTGKTILDDDRMKYEGEEFYLKSPEEMYALFPYAKEALANTQKIADRCHIEIAFNQYKLPKFQIPLSFQKETESEKENAYRYLQSLCEEGLTERFGGDAHLHRERLDYELNTIHSMGFVDYFLIVWDFIKFARDHNIMVGPGRGSGAASIVAYSLHITDVDPIKYNLVFERFLNPERVTMPDFDIDFCYERRQEVIEYVNEKYGADHVTQIITFGTMAARAATRDVGRALAMTYSDVDRVAKMIPTELGITISRALEINPELKTAYDDEEDTRYLLDMSMRLEGLPRHASTHAAGVVICDKPVNEYVPLNVNDGVVTTQFPMTTVEELGLLKMDFLGLRTLTVIRKAADEIERGHGIHIDLDHMDYDDAKVYETISQAKTEGVFQLESGGMKSFMKDLRPDNLEDVIAGIALYRPGPMDFIPKYIKGKRNAAKISYTHPSLAPILRATYGCIVYQEQVMQIVRDLAGYSMGRSDLVRRAMSKKKADVMAQERENFIHGLGEDVPGCIKNGIPENVAAKVFDEMTDFAKYAFNKAHAAAYAVICYQTAWIKYYYPVEFMAAILTSVMDFPTKVAEYIQVCKKMNIELLPPDINEGFGHFSVSGKRIRFSLSAIKNVGRGTVEAIVAEREANGKFQGMTDFITRMEAGDINKRCVESLVKSGAFDSLGGKRSQYTVLYRAVMNGMSISRKRTMDGQMNLFEMEGMEPESVKDELPPSMEEFALRTLLNDEKEVLGVYVSGHPLSSYEKVLQQYANTNSLNFLFDAESGGDALTDGQMVRYGGMITDKSIKYTKANNKAMAFLTVEDLYGTLEVIVFPNLYEKYGPRLQIDQVLIIQGRVSAREDEDAKLIANELLLYEDLPNKDGKTVWIKIPKTRQVSMQSVTDVLKPHRGDTRVMIYNEKSNQKFLANESFWVRPCPQLFGDVEMLLGNGTIKMTGA
ncbi:MAG: DNA polymerase III subunit alpha [Clostridiales bacterium]|jgi:DNA polymerase-3 subunit alpha|nr:DNA polymerase III subunit alpha [Clostridiales bacterium]